MLELSESRMGEIVNHIKSQPPVPMVDEAPAAQPAQAAPPAPSTQAASPETLPQAETQVNGEEKPKPKEPMVQVEVIDSEEPKEIEIPETTNSYLKSLDVQEEAQTQTPQRDVLTEDQISQLREAQAILSDPRVKQYKDFLDKGGDIVEFAKSIVGEDISKISDDQLHNEYLNSLNLTPEEFKEEQESFASKTRLERAAIVKPLRDERKASQDKKASEFIKSVPDQRSKVKEAATAAINELKNSKSNYVGKTIDGIVMTEEMYNSISNSLINGSGYAIPMTDQRGNFIGYDIKRSIEFANYELNKKTIFKNHIEMGKTLGWNEFYSKRKRTSPQQTGSIPVVTTTPADAVKKLHENKNNFETVTDKVTLSFEEK